MDKLPRIRALEVALPSTITVHWKGGITDSTADLRGWIARGGAILGPLRDPSIFATAAPTDHGAAIGWNDDDDLAIDAFHFLEIANGQSPVDRANVVQWQERLDLSNAEAADFLGLARSTWNLYKAGDAEVPHAIRALMWTASRDPVVVEAFLRPRRTGRPRKRA